MQADLHYYVTFLAAFAEGFPPDDARAIAMAAHYCDCSGDPGPLYAPWEQGKVELQRTIGPVRTLYASNDSAKSSFIPGRSTDNAAYRDGRDLWAAFHFLPGQDADFDPDYPFVWDHSPANSLGARPNPATRLTADRCAKNSAHPQTPEQVAKAALPENQKVLPWRCFPQSVTIRALRRHTIETMRDAMQAGSSTIYVPGKDRRLWQVANNKNYALSVLGVRLHVLADTFSHAGCSAGVTYANLFSDIWALHRGSYEPVNFAFASRSPWSERALGHAYYGGLPDLPGLSWKAENAGFDRNTIYRCNPVGYKCAVDALRDWCRAGASVVYPQGDVPADAALIGTRTAVRDFLTNLDFSSGHFAYPGPYYNPVMRNRDAPGVAASLLLAASVMAGNMYSTEVVDPLELVNSPRHHEVNGAQINDSLEARCRHLYQAITTLWAPNPVPVPLAKIHGRFVREHAATDKAAFKSRESAVNLGHELSARFSTDLHTWDSAADNDSEYAIVRRLRVLYFEEGGHGALKDVNAAAANHVAWFDGAVKDVLPRDWG